MNRRTILFCSLLLGVALLPGCARRERVVAARELTPVRAVTLRPSPVTRQLRYAATVEPLMQVTLAFRTPGVVEHVRQVRGVDGRMRPLETGDFVAAGSVLAAIRSTEYRARTDAAAAQLSDAQASRAAAAAQVAEAEAAHRQAELDWSRARQLLAGQAMTRAEADAAHARFDGARARLDAARAQVAALDAKVAGAGAVSAESKVSLSDTSVVAPGNAYVVSRLVERGAFAQPGAPAFVLADLTRVKIIFFVPDTALAAFRPGTRVTAAVDALPGEEVAALVQSVSPAADPVTRNFRVEAVAANPGRKLSAGLVGSVAAPEAPAPGDAASLFIPLSALVKASTTGGGFAVFVIDGPRVHLRPVELGEARGNEVGIRAGLLPNQRIVREGVARLKDGDPVQVAE